MTVVSVDKITTNRHQPRHHFAEEPLQNLANSIQEQGIIQPLVVTPTIDGRYELIAGERRFRAARLAGLTEVPVVVRNLNENKMLELALIENIQREDLNPIEEARGYLALQEQFQMNHHDIAVKVGKSRETIANSLRLLKLPTVIQEDVIEERLSASHARVLLGLTTLEDQLAFRERILQETLSVRDVERMVGQKLVAVRRPRQRLKKDLSPQMKMLIDDMQNSLGTKVRLQAGRKEGEGELIVEFYTWQDLDRIYRRMVPKTNG